MYKKMQGIDKITLALKYPDFHTWRDLDTAMAKGRFWPNGDTVCISDLEMRLSQQKRREKEHNENNS